VDERTGQFGGDAVNFRMQNMDPRNGDGHAIGQWRGIETSPVVRSHQNGAAALSRRLGLARNERGETADRITTVGGRMALERPTAE
jgi:hypothetical protein